MTATEKVKTLIAAAQELANRSLSDPELAERLLANTHDTIAAAAGLPIPAGILMKARRLDNGTVEISGQTDSRFEGELDDAALENVAGGRGRLTGEWVVGPLPDLVRLQPAPIISQIVVR